MADTNVQEEIQKEQQQVQKQFDSPYDFLKTIQGAPSEETIKGWKKQTPNGRIKVFSPDGKRVFLVRGVSGLELSIIQKQIPQGVTPDKAEQELALAVGSATIIWTNTTPMNKVTVEELRAGSAGLPATIFQLVSSLSDFVEPDVLNVLSAEL